MGSKRSRDCRPAGRIRCRRSFLWRAWRCPPVGSGRVRSDRPGPTMTGKVRARNFACTHPMWEADIVTTSRPGLREAKKQATREALREAALRLAVERGPDQVRVEDIASAAGVSPRTYNNYFASREQAIVAAVTADREARVAAAVTARRAGVRLADAVTEALVEQYTDTGEHDRRALVLITTRPALRDAFLDSTAGIEPPPHHSDRRTSGCHRCAHGPRARGERGVCGARRAGELAPSGRERGRHRQSRRRRTGRALRLTPRPAPYGPGPARARVRRRRAARPAVTPAHPVSPPAARDRPLLRRRPGP